MATFYLDNCISPKIALELRRLPPPHNRHTAVATQARRLGHAGDGEQLLTAVQRGEIMVTSNRRDFLLLHDAWLAWYGAGLLTQAHHGVLVILQAWTPNQAAHELTAFMVGRASLDNTAYLFRLGVGWEQRS